MINKIKDRVCLNLLYTLYLIRIRMNFRSSNTVYTESSYHLLFPNCLRKGVVYKFMLEFHICKLRRNEICISLHTPRRQKQKKNQCPSPKIKDNEKLDQKIKEKQEHEKENTMTRNVMA